MVWRLPIAAPDPRRAQLPPVPTGAVKSLEQGQDIILTPNPITNDGTIAANSATVWSSGRVLLAARADTGFVDYTFFPWGVAAWNATDLEIGNAASGEFALGVNANNVSAIVVRRGTSDSGAPIFVTRKSRGTWQSPVIVSTGDGLGSLVFEGWNASLVDNPDGYVHGAEISAVVVDPSPSITALGTKLTISTTPNGSITPTLAATFDQDQTLILANPLKVPSGGTGQSALTAHSVLIGNGAGAVNLATIGTAGRVLTDNGAGADPSFQAPAAAGGTATITTAGSITAKALVSFGSAGLILADATDDTKKADAFSVSSYTIGATATITLPGQVLTGLTASGGGTLTAGGLCYLATAGGITQTVPSSGASQIVGTALDTTRMLLAPGSIGLL